MARLITINGPLGVGKTWTVNRLKEYFGVQAVNFVDVNMQEPFKKIAYDVLGIPSSFPYDQMKVTKYHGFTGREWMIKISESMKEMHPTIWVEKSLNLITVDSCLPSNRKKIYMIDSQGFEVEMIPLVKWGELPENDLIQIGIEPPEERDRRGMKWQENDSRYNLCHLLPETHVLPDSNEAYWFLKSEIQKRGWA